MCRGRSGDGLPGNSDSESNSKRNTAIWSLTETHIFEWNYLSSSVHHIKRLLALLGLDLEIRLSRDECDVKCFRVHHKKPVEYLTYQEIQDIVGNLEERLSHKDSFDYHSVVKFAVKEAAKILAEEAPYLSSEKILSITPEVIVPFGMPVYEWGFSAGGLTIAYPDANYFTKDHIALWDLVAPRPNRLFRDYYYRSLGTPLHEVIHNLQTLGLQAKEMKLQNSLWDQEFYASYPMLFLAEKVYDPAIASEVVLNLFEITEAGFSTAGEETVENYKRWRDSFGAQAASSGNALDYFVKEPVATFVFKTRISLETWAQEKYREGFASEERGDEQKESTLSMFLKHQFDFPASITEKVPPELFIMDENDFDIIKQRVHLQHGGVRKFSDHLRQKVKI